MEMDELDKIKDDLTIRLSLLDRKTYYETLNQLIAAVLEANVPEGYEFLYRLISDALWMKIENKEKEKEDE